MTALLFLSLYCFNLIAALFSRPIYGVYAYLTAFYMHPQSNFWGASLPDIRYSFIAAIVTLLVVLFKEKERRKLLEFPENKYFFIFLIYVTLQNLWAINSTFHIDYNILAFKFLILIYLFQNTIQNKNDLIGFVVANLIGICYFGYVGLISDFSGRMENIGGPGIRESNTLAQHVLAVLFFSGFLLFCRFGRKVIYLFPFLALGVQTLLMTGSRSAIISLILTGLLSIFLIPKSVKKLFWTYASAAIVVLGIALSSFMVERFQSMMSDETTGEIKDSSARSRFVIIEAQWEMFKESPIIGHGHAGTTWLSPFYIADEYRSQGKTTSKDKDKPTYRASHNFVMTLLVDHGLIGAFLYSMIILKCFKRVLLVSKIDVESDPEFTLKILCIGFGLSLLAFMITGLGSNNKVLEMDIWLYSLIPLIHSKLIAFERLKTKKAHSSNSKDGLNSR